MRAAKCGGTAGQPPARTSKAKDVRGESLERIRLTELGAHVGQRVVLCAWLHQKRKLGKITFLVLRDGYGVAQLVIGEDDHATVPGDLAPESALRVEASVVASDKAPGGVELAAPKFEILSVPAAPRPVELGRPHLKEPLPYQLDHAAIALRHPERRATFEIAAAALHGFRASLDAQGFREIATPKIVASATETGANVFPLDYFGRPAFLAQSPQFYKQIMAGVLERVYETAPVFRAEPHDTARHLSQYLSLDAEMAFVKDHTTVMAVLEVVVEGMLEAVLDRAAAAIARLGVEVPTLRRPIPRVHFADAQPLIEGVTGESLAGEPDLAPEHERVLGAWALREHGSDFLFVTGYPMEKRPFYTHPEPGRPQHSNSFDLLFRGLELVTGGQRLHRYEDYVAALEARGQPLEPYEGYLECFRAGMPPHGGFALGLERFVARLVGAKNVRETTLFPRDLRRLTP